MGALLPLLPYVLLFLGVGGFWAYDKGTIAGQKARIEALTKEIDDPMTGWRRQLSVCVDSKTDLKSEFNILSGKVDSLGQDTKKVKEAQDRLGAQTARDARDLKGMVEDILTAPRLSPDACTNALAVQRAPLQ